MFISEVRQHLYLCDPEIYKAVDEILTQKYTGNIKSFIIKDFEGIIKKKTEDINDLTMKIEELNREWFCEF